MPRLHQLLLLAATLLTAACSASSPGPTDADADSPDAAGAWSLSGSLLDLQGDPIPKAMLVLCGTVQGAEVCNQSFSADDGRFEYSGLLPGYTHLQILPFQSEAVTGKRYSGACLPVPAAPPEHLDLGTVLLPVVTETAHVHVDAQSVISGGGLTLTIPANSLSLPDAGDEGDLGGVGVPPDKLPFDQEGVLAAFAFYPFSTTLSQPATVAVSLADLGLSPTPAVEDVKLLYNPLDAGGLAPLAATANAGTLSATVSALTWIVVTTTD